MTGFDILVLVVVGALASLGFLRGFVQEAISLFAWGASIFAIHNLHSALSAWLTPHVGTQSGASVLAFVLLLFLPYLIVRGVARYLGSASRGSALAPVDRVLGFGFGAVKGTLIIVLGYSVLMLGYDTIWGPSGRPDWIRHSRCYSFIDASSVALVDMIGKRRREAQQADQTPEPVATKKPVKPIHHKPHRAAE
jgi:membrane protein required for colicin V production